MTFEKYINQLTELNREEKQRKNNTIKPVLISWELICILLLGWQYITQIWQQLTQAESSNM